MPMGRDNGSPRRDDSASRAMRSRRQTTGEKPGNEIIPDMKQPPLTARRMTNASPCTRAIGGVFRWPIVRMMEAGEELNGER